MWLDGSLYVAAPPHIWKLTDTDDDGVADKEEIWFDGKTLTGCANDLHGPYLGPDGWIYWCKGAFAKQEYTMPNGKKFEHAGLAHLPRPARRHRHRTGHDRRHGQPGRCRLHSRTATCIFSTTFFQHPRRRQARRPDSRGLRRRLRQGPRRRSTTHPWTEPDADAGDDAPGPGRRRAACTATSRDQFGEEYANNLFCCQFNMHKVSRHVLVPTGSTYTTKDSDFVVSDNLDFHPTDVIEDADGSLLIVDTGGWYKLCCPTSQLVKPDVTGAIYRVKKIGRTRWRTRGALRSSGRTRSQRDWLFFSATRCRAVEGNRGRGRSGGGRPAGDLPGVTSFGAPQCSKVRSGPPVG